MEDSVQHQHLHLLGGRMSQPCRVFRGDIDGNGDVSGQRWPAPACALQSGSRERQHICLFIVAAKSPVQSPYCGTAGQKHIGPILQTSRRTGFAHEALERRSASGRTRFFQKHQDWLQIRSERWVKPKLKKRTRKSGPPENVPRVYSLLSKAAALSPFAREAGLSFEASADLASPESSNICSVIRVLCSS